MVSEAVPDIQMNMAFWMALSIFIVALTVIMSEKIHKTVVAVGGASLMLVLKIITQRQAFHVAELGVDWNVIFLLISMMVIINLVRPTGMFEYIAVKSAKAGRGDPMRIMVILSVVTAVISSILDNVTTVLLIAPVTLLIADALDVDAIPYLIVEALASNIGGTATLIGDPPNIMIASKAKLDFMDFIIHLMPAIVLIMLAFLVIIRIVFRKQMRTRDELKKRIMDMDEREAIKDPAMLKKSLFVLGLVLIGFIFHGILDYEPATIALFGAALLMLLSRTQDPHQILAEVEWPVIFFFIGLFIMVGGVVRVGAIKLLSMEVLRLTHGNLFGTSMLVMWFSALASAVVDNIPYVATMNPLIVDMARELWPHKTGIALLQYKDLMPIWWSLALGACLGGNGTAIGASANVIVVGMAEKSGKKISFLKFLLYGLPIMLATVIIATLYVCLRYYVLHR